MQLRLINQLAPPNIDMTNGTEFGVCTTNSSRVIKGAFYPKSISDIRALICWATEQKQTLWPVSTGKNWGYGTALPVTDHNYIVSLSKMSKILDFDPIAGVITVEPGVTQQALYDYLSGTPFISPVTGAGPRTSVLGNLLERGYGLAPHQDHFSSLMCLKAVLGNGEIYSSPLTNIAGQDTDRAFKWGIGPYLDGLFGQSNFGIVSEVTIKLAKRPNHQKLVKLSVKDDQLLSLVGEIQQIIEDYGELVSGINLMNKERVNAMTRRESPDWTGIFSINAPDQKIVQTAYKSIKKRLKPYAKCISINTGWLDLLSKLPLPAPIKENVLNAKAVKAILNGEPTSMALNLAYLHNSAVKRSFDPAKDGCGLIWYSPIVKMKPDAVAKCVEHVNSICEEYSIDPLITLTSMGSQCFHATIPILFDKDCNDHSKRADDCFYTLLETGRKHGLFPYRLPIDAMEYLTDINPAFFQHVNKIKSVLDPNNIIAPGRYCPL